MPTQIRVLTEIDGEAYRVVRRRALLEHPEAYGSTVDDLDRQSVEELASGIAYQPGKRACYGAFVDGALAGLALFFRSPNEKLHHRAGLFQMYVTPEHRRFGLGRQLVTAVVTYARGLAGLEELILAVTVGNTAAEQLYLRAGFVPSYVEPRYLKLDNHYYDLLWMSLPLPRSTPPGGPHPVENPDA
jgi:GNAT superfamily N-acetyltransferase